MTRFAATMFRRNDGDGAAASLRRVRADLARRAQAVPQEWGESPLRIMQAGGGAGHDGTPHVGRLGPLALAADLGLTDLAELRTALLAAPQDGPLPTDPAGLLLAAWLRWGVDALERLNGAFAFVLWDDRSRRLVAVRDRFGVRPLAYAETPDRIVIAGDLSTLLAGLDTAPGINRNWVADFLSGQFTSPRDTAHAGIFRLPPGHLMTVDEGGEISLRAWYRLDRTSPRAASDPPGALREALAHATVQACADGPTATMLSGGLDSSALSLLSIGVADEGASQGPRLALSLRYADPALDEGRFIDDVLRRADGRLLAQSLPGEMQADLFDLDALLDEQDQPVFAPGLGGNRRLYRAARAAGHGAILDGHGGDEVIGGAFWNIARIAAQGRWGRALALALREARFSGESPAQAVALLLAWQGRRGFGRLGRWMARDLRTDPVEWRSLVAPKLAQETALVDRVRALHGGGDPALPESVRLHAAMLTAPLIATAFEVQDRAARAAGVVPRYPFYDHRVVELCIWQPDVAKIARGRPRALLREAMRGILPDSVRLRRDKTDFIADFWLALRRDPTGWLAGFRAGPGVLEGWVDAAILRADADRLAQSSLPDPQTAFRLWRAVWLAAWLERRAAIPSRTAGLCHAM